MPVTKTAERALNQASRRQIINVRRKRQFKTMVNAFKAKPTAKSLRTAIQSVDRAAKHQIVTFNKASRLKSQLARLLNS